MIASGGVGDLEHLARGLVEGGADAVLAASIFHDGQYTIGEAKAFLAERGVRVRLANARAARAEAEGRAAPMTTASAGVTVADVIEAVRRKKALLAPETAGYLVLGAADQIAGEPALVDEHRCGVLVEARAHRRRTFGVHRARPMPNARCAVSCSACSTRPTAALRRSARWPACRRRAMSRFSFRSSNLR